jgi:hypothetical protein
MSDKKFGLISNTFYENFLRELHHIFDLSEDKDSANSVMEAIRRSVEF